MKTNLCYDEDAKGTKAGRWSVTAIMPCVFFLVIFVASWCECFAANDYNIKILVGTNVIGDAEQVSLPAGSSCTITDYLNGVREAIISSLAGVGGGGSAAPFVLLTDNCIDLTTVGTSGTNIIGVSYGCLHGEGFLMMDDLSTLESEVGAIGAVTNGTVLAAEPGVLLTSQGAGTNGIGADFSLVVSNQALINASNTIMNALNALPTGNLTNGENGVRLNGGSVVSTADTTDFYPRASNPAGYVTSAQVTNGNIVSAGFGITTTPGGQNTQIVSVASGIFPMLASNNTFTANEIFNGGSITVDNGGLFLGAGAPLSVNNAGATLTTMTVNNAATFNYFAWFQSNVWDMGATVISNTLTVTGTTTIPGLSANANGTNTMTGVWVSSASLVGSGFGPALTNGLVGTLTSASPQFGTFSAANNNGLVTLTLNPGLLTNGLTSAFWMNGPSVFSNNVTVTAPFLATSTATISNNATITGTLFVNGAISAPGGFVGITTGSVASVNGLVSNVTIAVSGHPTISTVASGTGGTITISDPTQFASTNTSTTLQPAPLFWDTKYGALRVSNNFGATFINTPDLSTTSNENVTLTDYFVNTTTSAWITVNGTNAWTCVNSNNWLWIQSSGPPMPNWGTYYLKAIPTTNQSWRCRVLVQPMVGENGSYSFNAGFGPVAAEGTNANLHAFVMWRGSATTPELRAFVSATAISTFATPDAFDSSSEAQWWQGPISTLELGPPAPIWLQISYDGSNTMKYTYSLSVNGLPPPITQNGQYSFIKTNQAVNPQYVGIAVIDSSSTKPTFAIKAFVFEQP
ncbi:MAG: hypothetical protein ABSA12_10490 [Verrucomicrobiia bacterium]|jgi:hypothetical protein